MDIIEAYYRENHKKLFKIVARRFGNNSHLAEEAVQEAFTRALRSIALYDPSKPFSAWFNTILNNAVNDLKREEMNKGATKSTEELENIADDKIKDDFAYWSQLKDKIKVDIEKVVNPGHKDILRFYFLCGMKVNEIHEAIEGFTYKAILMTVLRFEKYLLSKYALV